MNTMANPEPDPTEASPPAMQQLFFTSAEMPPHHMRGRIPQETRSEWSASQLRNENDGNNNNESLEP